MHITDDYMQSKSIVQVLSVFGIVLLPLINMYAYAMVYTLCPF